TARTLAHSLGKPLVGVSSLAALARPVAAAFDPRQTLVVAATDACNGELFALWGVAGALGDCVVKAEGDFPGVWKRSVEEQMLTPEKRALGLQKKRRGSKSLRWVAVGEGRHRYADAWGLLPSARRLELPPLFPDTITGRAVAQLAWEACQHGIARD